MAFKFNCADCDDDGEQISGTGCGDIPVITLHLYHFLDREGEGLYISFNEDGEFFFSKEQEKYLGFFDKQKIIDHVVKSSQNGKNLDIGECPKCHRDVSIEEIGVVRKQQFPSMEITEDGYKITYDRETGDEISREKVYPHLPDNTDPGLTDVQKSIQRMKAYRDSLDE